MQSGKYCISCSPSGSNRKSSSLAATIYQQHTRVLVTANVLNYLTKGQVTDAGKYRVIGLLGLPINHPFTLADDALGVA